MGTAQFLPYPGLGVVEGVHIMLFNEMPLSAFSFTWDGMQRVDSSPRQRLYHPPHSIIFANKYSNPQGLQIPSPPFLMSKIQLINPLKFTFSGLSYPGVD